MGAAYLAATVIESRAQDEVTRSLRAAGLDWAEIEIDGLLLTLRGTAPSEAMRFRALTAAGEVIDPTRVIDEMEVLAPEEIAPPRFSLEMLRNSAGISLIGLVPAVTDRARLLTDLRRESRVDRVTDMLEAADYPAPETWEAALRFGLEAIALLPRAKISVSARRIQVTAISTSPEEKAAFEAALAERLPETVEVALEISAPRPVVSPYALRFLIDESGARFDACTAATEEDVARILTAAQATDATCTIGLGAPSGSWAEAAEIAIAALTELGQGSLTFADADVSLVAHQDTPQADFDLVVGELEAALPPVFSLHAVLPEPDREAGQTAGDVEAEFVATKSPEGLVQLRGRLTDERERTAVESFAAAKFGHDKLSPATRLDEGLPEGWPIRVIAGLDALAGLNNGMVRVAPDYIEIRGVSGDQQMKSEIARILSTRLGSGQRYTIEVTYQEALDPQAGLPTPEECVDSINTVLSEQQILFAPGSSDIEAASLPVVGRIADVMEECSEVPMEVGGHTDSQGRESMNQSLSKSRAEAVVTALQARRVLTGNLTTEGYGETKPIADNGTEEGRETNRRIEFRLLPDAPPEETEDEPN